MRTIRDDFRWFLRERENIRMKRERGDARPFTADERLQRYWFPNIRRMDDPTTVWLHGAVLRRLEDPEQVIMAAVTFRMFGRRETGEALLPMLLVSGYHESGLLGAVGPLEHKFNSRLQRHHRGMNLERITSTLSTLAAENGRWPLLKGASLREATRALSGVRGIGPELAYEVICDLRWTPVLQGAPDALSWALPGRSAVEVAGDILGREMRNTRQEDRREAVELMRSLLDESRPEFPDWEMSEIQRGLTMFHFWCRDKRPTRRYR